MAKCTVQVKRLEKWLEKGSGGEWYEPCMSNWDSLLIIVLTLLLSVIFLFSTTI
jgi:hypothetical protein